MIRNPFSLTALIALASVAPGQAPEPREPQTPAALAKARLRAAVHNKRVLIVLQQDGQDLASMIRRDRVVSRAFKYEFEVVVLASGQYESHRRPSLLLEDAQGKRLLKLAEPSFFADEKLRSKELLSAVTPYFCEPVDAQKKLAAAMSMAKKAGKNILIRFDAPW